MIQNLFRDKYKKWTKRILCGLLSVTLMGIIGIGAINFHIKHSVQNYILTDERAAELSDMDCILVLGCLVKSNGIPSDMLADRLQKGVALYQSGVSQKLLMSGDHGRSDYNEVQAMKDYAERQDIPSSDIFMDHAGFSTYESMYRAKEIFGVKRMVIVTQGYHLYRALYIARELGIEAYGVAADYRTYLGQQMRDMREVVARAKDFVNVIARPKPTYLGEQILITGDGNLTND